MEIGGVNLAEIFLKLKWGVFAGACFTCHKFGHVASGCSSVLHQPPLTALPRNPPQSRNNANPKNVSDKQIDKGGKSALHAWNQASTG